jgi:hypothetical protein
LSAGAIRGRTMSGTLQARLAGVGDSRVRIVDWDVPVEGGDSPIVVRFENGARLHATYWRLIKHEKAALSSFDDRQRYGLAAPIDARAVLRSELDDRRCTAIRFDGVTGDLLLDFTEGPRLQVFNFTGYEIWHIVFPDGTEQYSNHASAAE